MRFLVGLVCMGLIAGSVQAQSIINGPTSGFVAGNKGTTIYPILGIPGASILGDRVRLDVDIRNAAVSPKHDYAIAERSEDTQVIVIDLRSEQATTMTVAG